MDKLVEFAITNPVSWSKIRTGLGRAGVVLCTIAFFASADAALAPQTTLNLAVSLTALATIITAFVVSEVLGRVEEAVCLAETSHN